MCNLPIELPERLLPAEGDEHAPDALVLVVVGAQLDCERIDRPLAYRLCRRLAEAIDGDGRPDLPRPMPCTDLWFVNNHRLRQRPAIAIGRPDANAGTAYLASRIPTAFAVDDRIRIHLDPAFEQAGACFWGTRPEDAEAALDVFVDRYLHDWVAALPVS